MQLMLKLKRIITVCIVILLMVTFVLPVSVFANDNSVTVTAISASEYFALALKSNGTVWGWGSNSFGQLGDGSTVEEKVPVPVQGLSNVSAISAGGAFSLALKTDGTVWSWGYNDGGQLGDGTRLAKLTPVQVKGLEHIVAISAGINHGLALKDDGTVWVWGNSDGALGLGKGILMQEVPVQINGINNVSSIAAGYNSSYALKTDGTVWSWGLNNDGQLGIGTSSNEFQPTQITSLSDVQSLKAGKSVLALKKDGTVWQWGWGLDSGGKFIRRYYPELVPGLNDVSTIANGSDWNVAVKLDGSVWAWGYNVCDGNGVRENINEPRFVKGLQGIKNAVSGYQYFLALANDGTVWAWGDNAGGVLGDGTTVVKLYPVKSLITNEENMPFVTLSCFWGGQKNPVYNQSSIISVYISTRIDSSTLNKDNISITDDHGQSVDFRLGKGDSSFQLQFEQGFQLGVHYKLQVSNLKDVWGNSMDHPYQWAFTGILPGFMTPSTISAGRTHSLATKGFDVYSWGNNSYGQLGDGTTINRLSPVKIPNLGSAPIFAGGDFSLARLEDGSVVSWGANNEGQLGDGTLANHSTPVKVLGLSDIMGLAAGDQHSLALRQDGTVWAWGNNAFGQLGDGTNTTRATPVQVAGLTNVIHIAAGGGHSLAVKDDGTVWAWGDNGAGELGDGVSGNSLIPVQVQGLTDVKAVSAGFEYSFALKNDQSLWAWGNNNRGQLGDGTNITRTIPVHILDNIIQVDAGYDHSLASQKNGIILAWGNNTLNQLGDDSDKSYTSTPQVVKNPSYGNFSGNFSAGGAHSMVEVSSSDYWFAAWGFNFYGQLGDGSTYHRTTPEVLGLTDEGGYYRLSGQDRIETSVMVSQEGWNYGASAVILARSDDFPDALTGAPLGYVANAPILLTDSKVLTPATQNEIERLGPRTVYILGSTGAISQTIEDKLSKKYKIIRLGGTDRYDTSAKIAEYLKDVGFATTGKAVVAYGENFPDALAVSSLAAYQHLPILLSETNELPAPTQLALTKLQVNETIVVGGNGVISQKVADLLPKAVRYSGKDRYETAFAIAQNMGADTGLIYISTGNNFPDALAGSSLAARTNSPILLVDQNLGLTGKQYLTSTSRKPLNFFLLGGESVVPDSVLFDLPFNE